MVVADVGRNAGMLKKTAVTLTKMTTIILGCPTYGRGKPEVAALRQVFRTSFAIYQEGNWDQERNLLQHD
jgi:hypothetical protein